MSVRLGILGTANIAAKVVKAMHRADGAAVMAVASRRVERAKEWASENGVPRWFGSYDELLEDPDIDAVYIPLPPSLHAEWTIKAAEKGKHVLCEKPLAMDSDESTRMANACRSAGVQLMDGVMWVHHDRTGAMKRVIDDGRLGRLRHVSSVFTFNWGDTPPSGNIRADKSLGGGCLGDLGYYCVRSILWAFGVLPSRVSATARYRNGVSIDLTGMLEFDDDRTATLYCSFNTHPRQWLEVSGTEGHMLVDRFVLPSEDGAEYTVVRKAPDGIELFKTEPCVQEVMMVEHFCSAVESGTVEDRYIRDALDTMKVCDALAESAEQAAPIEL
jgi:predicted dehydrogenase